MAGMASRLVVGGVGLYGLLFDGVRGHAQIVVLRFFSGMISKTGQAC